MQLFRGPEGVCGVTPSLPKWGLVSLLVCVQGVGVEKERVRAGEVSGKEGPGRWCVRR